MTGVAQFRYRAFLSYSHRDHAWGRWLHNALEGFAVDRDLVGRDTVVGPIPKTLRPIFRDRDDFSAGNSLSKQTLSALEASQFLIVLCSPHAAKSAHVNEEVRHFKVFGRSDRILPLIVDGLPGDPHEECFPPALRFTVGADGEITESREEPIAADARPGGDGKQIAKLKTIAGLLGIGLDEIIRREERARKRRNFFWAALAVCFFSLAVAATGSAIYGYKKLIQSEERLDSAIEIAYGFVSEATSLSDKFGVPIEVSVALLRRGEAALNALIASGSNSSLLKYRKAQMLLSLSDSYDSLGRTDEALARSNEAKSVLRQLVEENPSRYDWQLSLIRAYIYNGVYLTNSRTLASALENYEEGLVWARALVQHQPDNVDAATSVARLLVNIGNVKGLQGHVPEALKAHKSALDFILEFAGTTNLGEAVRRYPDLEYMAFASLDKQAMLQKIQGNFEAALKYFSSKLDRDRSESEANPTSIELLLVLHRSHLELGNVLIEVGSIDEALANFEKGLSIAQRLSASDPPNVAYKKAVALLKDGVGRALLARGSVHEALEVFRANLREAKAFIVADPANSQWQRNLSEGYGRIGDALMEAGDFNAAIAEYRAEEKILSKLTQDIEAQLSLAHCRFKIGDALVNRGDKAAAKQLLETSFAVLRDHSDKFRSFVEYQAWVYKAGWRLAEINGDLARLNSAKNGLSLLSSKKALTADNRRWLATAEKSSTISDLECSSEDPDRAIVNCTALVAQAGSDRRQLSRAYQRRGDAYRNKQQYEAALADFNEAIVADPDNVIAHNNRGLTYEARGILDKAIQDYDAAIRLDPTFAIAYSNRGVALQKLGETERAIADLSEAIRIEPENPLSYFNRAICYVALQLNDQAIRDFGEVVRLRPHLAIGYLNRGAAYSAKGESDKAIVDLTEAIRLEPRASAFNLRGVAYFQSNQFERSLNDFNEAIRLEPGDAIAYTNRGRVYEKQGRFAQAITEHDLSIKLSPGLAIAYANRGLAHEGVGRVDEALVDFEKALALEPSLTRALEGRQRIQAAQVTAR